MADLDDARAILAGWTAPDDKSGARRMTGLPHDEEHVIIAETAAGWLIVGVDSYGRTHAGCRADLISLANDLATIAEAEQASSAQPPPTAPSVALTDADQPSADAAPELPTAGLEPEASAGGLEMGAEILDVEMASETFAVAQTEGSDDLSGRGDRALLDSDASHHDGDGDGTGDGRIEGGDAYPGILVLPDELGAARRLVVEAITEQQIIREGILAEPGWENELNRLLGWFMDHCRYDGHALPEMPAKDIQRMEHLQQTEMRIAMIARHAHRLREAASRAPRETLDAMVLDVWDGGP